MCRIVGRVSIKNHTLETDGPIPRTRSQCKNSHASCLQYMHYGGGGGRNAVAGIGKKCRKRPKIGQKCDGKCVFVSMVYAP